MKIEALEQLKRVVSDIPNGDLNMRLWICGTQACVLGHAAMDPWFNRRGLNLALNLVPHFKGQCGYGAAEKFFGISMSQAKYVFSPGSYCPVIPTSKSAIIEHIDAVIRAGR